jgi:hypothetical protein
MNDPQTHILLESLMTCIASCERCADACLEEHGMEHAHVLRLARDCADICTITARFIGRGSPYAQELLLLCITLCKACEKECRKYDELPTLDCAAACRECHMNCEAYATMAQH